MLTTKRINLGISVVSRVLRIFLILYAASILANSIWWVISPANTNVFIQWADLDIRDKAIGYINNRYPFGIVVIAKAKEKERPRIVDQLKLTGVYLSADKDSFAFLEYQGKPTVTRIGDEIASSGAIVKSINIDNIVVDADNQEATINVTSGVVAQAGSSSFGSGSSNNNPDTMFSGRGKNNSQGNDNTNSQSNQSSNQAVEDFRQQRRKVLEEFNARNNTNKARESSSDDDE